MTPEVSRLFGALADGRTLNGTRYAADAGIGRAAVWKQVEQLRGAGLPVAAVRGSGYRLAWPIILLDTNEIRRAAGPGQLKVETVESTQSTNLDLLARFSHRKLLAAEYQAGGRGRRGRGWISPPGCGACFSVGFTFDCGLQRLGPLSLVAGVVAAEALAGEGVSVGLKWPNDLVVEGAKLGGLLIEIRGASEGPCEVVAGVGVNFRLPRGEAANAVFHPPDQSWTDLHAAAPAGHDLDRNRLIGRLAGAMCSAFEEFERHGFEPFISRWQAHDVLHGRSVRVMSADGAVLEGVAAGVDAQGHLRLEHAEGIRTLNAGDVSVRAN